jgi:O-antigen/teichoic acid export membrane protein
MRKLFEGQFRRQVGTTFAAQVLSACFTIVNAALIARWLGVESKGILSLLLLVPNMLGLFLGGGIGVANVYYTGSRHWDIPNLTQNSVGITILATCLGIAGIGGAAMSGLLASVLPNVPLFLIFVALIGFPLNLLNGYLAAILQGLQRILTVNLVTVTQSMVTLILNLILVVGLNTGLIGALSASLLTGIIILIVVVSLLRQEGAQFRPTWRPAVMRSTLSYGLRGYIGNVLQFFNYRLDMFIVNYYLGAAGTGIYSVSVALAELLWYLPNAVGFVIFPKAAASKAEALNRFTPRVFGLTLMLTIVGGLGLAVVGQPFIRIVYSVDFLPAYGPLLALLPGVILLGSAKVLTNEIAGRGYPHYNSINSGLALIVTVGLDFLLIPRYGVLGASMASSIAYTLIFFTAIGFYCIVSRRATNEKLVESL